MPSSVTTRMTCRFCKSSAEDHIGGSECQSCLQKGSLVGRIVWTCVEDEVRNAPENNHILFMLTGLSAKFLEGIVRMAPRKKMILDRTLLIALHPEADSSLKVAAPAIESRKSATYWRNSTDAQVKLFATADNNRFELGASLGEVVRIDEDYILNNIDDWCKQVSCHENDRPYVNNLLGGLRESRILAGLEMWLEFVEALEAQDKNKKIENRVQDAAHKLQIPNGSLSGLPKSSPSETKSERRKFRIVMDKAEQDVKCFPMLEAPTSGDQISLNEVEEAMKSFPDQNKKTRDAFEYIRALFRDQRDIGTGRWLPSQENFCSFVPWHEIGSPILQGGARRTRRNIGEETREFVNRVAKDRVSEEDIRVIENMIKMGRRSPNVPNEDEIRFYDRWEEFLRHPNEKKLNAAWRKRVSKRAVTGSDLTVLLFDSFVTIVDAAADILDEVRDPVIYICADKANDKDYWAQRDSRALKQFQFELSTIQALLTDGFEWNVNVCFESSSDESKSSNSDQREMVLRVQVLDSSKLAEQIDSNHSLGPSVNVIWTPETKKGCDSIGLALPEDICDLENVIKNMGGVFYRSRCKSLRRAESEVDVDVSLENTDSFVDVQDGNEGRLATSEVGNSTDILDEVRSIIRDIAEAGNYTHSRVDNLLAAIDKFEQLYMNAIGKLRNNAGSAFASDIIDHQAIAFGDVCKAARSCATSNARKIEIFTRILSIGIVEVGDTGETAIMAGWHPYRLAERKAKIEKLREFAKDIIKSNPSGNINFVKMHQEERASMVHWKFPEVAILGEKQLIATENQSGYALLRPLGNYISPRGRNESLAKISANAVIDCIDRYLDVHPYKRNSLSLSVIQCENSEFISNLIQHLRDRSHRDSTSKFDLYITYDNSDNQNKRIAQVFQDQNRLLASKKIGDTSTIFLPKVRICICENDSLITDEIPYVDIAILYGVITGYARADWVFDSTPEISLDTKITLRGSTFPRRLLGETIDEKDGMYITSPRPPEAIAEYQNLIYEFLEKPATVPNGVHAAYIRSAEYDNEDIAKIIDDAHMMSNWVVTLDAFSSQTLLQKNGVSIIHDISLPSIDGRRVISTRCLEIELVENLEHDLRKFCNQGHDKIEVYRKNVVKGVLNISGQKLLTAARHSNVSHEMIGLRVMQAVIESNSATCDAPPIWLSLDDHRSWLLGGSGKCADAVAFSVKDLGDRFEVYMQVGEAKFVSKESKPRTVQEACKQVHQTVKSLAAIFSDDSYATARISLCSRLAQFLIGQSSLVKQIDKYSRRESFISALTLGDVKFRISGQAVICLHNDSGMEVESDYEETSKYISYCVLPGPIIEDVLRNSSNGSAIPSESFLYAEWYPGGGDGADILDAVDTREIREEGLIDTSVPVQSKDKSNTKAENVDEDWEDGITESKEDNLKPIPALVYDLLSQMVSSETATIDENNLAEWSNDICERTRSALSKLGMNANLSERKFRQTPSGILIEFLGNSSLTAGRVKRKVSELRTSHRINITDVREGLGTVSLFVLRPTRSQVSFASSWLSASWLGKSERRSISLMVGIRDDNGLPLFLNLAGAWGGYEEHGPHTLVAGSTGSGKGVLVQGLLLQLVTFCDPRCVEIILIDPKMGVDYSWLTGLPHLRKEIATDIEHSRQLFDDLSSLMDDRYRLFKNFGVGDISQYNDRVSEEDKMHRVFVVHDEFGAWMTQEKDYKNTVMPSIAYLAMKGRAAGIHLVLITQRADAEAVPPKLRDNMNNRLCLRVQDAVGSRMVLGKVGANNLTGNGHLACILENQQPPIGQDFYYVQVPYANFEKFKDLANAAKAHWSTVLKV